MPAGDQLGKSELHLHGRTEPEALGGRLADCSDDPFVGVPQDERALPADVIDILVGIHVGKGGALSLDDHRQRPGQRRIGLCVAPAVHRRQPTG